MPDVHDRPAERKAEARPHEADGDDEELEIAEEPELTLVNQTAVPLAFRDEIDRPSLHPDRLSVQRPIPSVDDRRGACPPDLRARVAVEWGMRRPIQDSAVFRSAVQALEQAPGRDQSMAAAPAGTVCEIVPGSTFTADGHLFEIKALMRGGGHGPHGSPCLCPSFSANDNRYRKPRRTGSSPDRRRSLTIDD